MRGRTVRTLVLILLILGVSLASLGFREIHVNVPVLPRVERAGTGPLGLKLGLDLRGGGHLVYQADTDTRIEAAFGRAVSAEEIKVAMAELGLAGFRVEPREGNSFRIKTPPLDDATRQKLQDALVRRLGALEPIKVAGGLEATPEQMEGVLTIIKRRVNLFGTEEPIVQRFGKDRVIVQLPGASGSRTQVVFLNPAENEKLKSVLADLGYEKFQVDQRNDRTFKITTAALSESAKLELRNALAERVGAIELVGAKESFQVSSGIDEAKRLIGQTARLEFKDRTCAGLDRDTGRCINPTDTDIGLTGDDLSTAFVSTDPVTSEWAVSLEFNGRGAGIFSELTQRIVGINTRRIATFLDDEMLIDPVARAWIRDGRSQITGNFSREEARTLAIQLESGRLPVPLKLIQESDVDALLGAESLRQSLIAGLVGLGLVAAFMVAYYRAAGVVAAMSLLFYAIIVLAAFKLVPVTLTLAGIAGFILSIGMAVDANVLIFERMKEEIRIGRTLGSSMEAGFGRAWPAIRDSNVTTFIACGILIWFGNRLGGELVTGFALTLFIGVAASMFTAVVVSRNLLQMLAWAGLSRRINLFTPERVQRPVATSAGR